jgi:hypothetical protein
MSAGRRGSWAASSCFDAKVERYARGNETGDISIRQVANDQELVCLPGVGLLAHITQFSPDGRFLAALYHHNSRAQLWVWDWPWRSAFQIDATKHGQQRL